MQHCLKQLYNSNAVGSPLRPLAVQQINFQQRECRYELEVGSAISVRVTKLGRKIDATKAHFEVGV